MGSGLAIAAACDLRVITADAKFGMPIARTVGNCLSMANYARLAALIGPQRTREAIFLAKLIDGPTALGIGLVSELLPDANTLQSRAEEVARTVANHAPITLQVTKEALRRLQARLGDDDIDDLIRLAYGSRDFREGMAAFLAKRAPKWSGT
jgi:enoyl-CoA hydratase/carnithine racemase